MYVHVLGFEGRGFCVILVHFCGCLGLHVSWTIMNVDCC